VDSYPKWGPAPRDNSFLAPLDPLIDFLHIPDMEKIADPTGTFFNLQKKNHA